MQKHDTIRSILDSLRMIVQELRMFSRRAEATHGLSAAQLFVLETVARNQPVSINSLAALTFTHQSSVSVVAQKLVDRKFLLRRRSVRDGRQNEISIASLGKKALKDAPVSVQDRLITAISAMRGGDQESLDRLLRTLTESIGLRDSDPVLFFENKPDAGRGSKRVPNTKTTKK